MVELQVINRILADRSLSIVHNNGLTPDHFVTHRSQYDFILSHHSQYGNVPDLATFIARFHDFSILEVTESDRYLIETLMEQYLYSQIVPVVNTIAEKVRGDSREAYEYARAEIERLGRLKVGFCEGYDLTRSADDRLREYESRHQHKGIMGISSGIKELDDITHGWMAEDLVTIVGRTNEGKSWVMLYLLTQAWKAGKRVLMYSGEMSVTTVGFRFDTLTRNFSNEALMQGLDNLGGSDDPMSAIDYARHIDSLKSSDIPFVIVTSKDLGGRLDIPKLHSLIEQHKPDIIGIDQLSLMSDYRAGRAEQERLKYTHIAEDLYLTSERYGVPIITPAQASRESVKVKAKDSENAPELHQIAESDGVGQNSTRVIGIKQIGSVMKLSIRKNRYGKNNQDIMMLWDLDRGVIKPFLQFDGLTGKSQMTSDDGSDLF